MTTYFTLIRKMKQIAFCCLLVFCSCQNNQWETIKSVNKVYPLKDSMELVELEGFFGGKRTVERNLSLKDYPYKKYCENLISVEMNLSDSEMNGYVARNYKSIPEMLLSEARKTSVTHYAGYTMDKQKLILLFYSDDGISLLHYDKIPCIFIYKKDPEWKAYQDLFNTK